MSFSRGADRRGAGEGVLAPWALFAVAALLINDHLLKGSGLLPGLLTGKLSDLTGLLFFPVFLEALGEAGAAASGRWKGPSRGRLGACIIATALAFSALQLLAEAAEIYRWGLGLLQAPFRALGTGVWAWRPVAAWPDPSDLWCLPVLLLTWRWGQFRGPEEWP